jgi:hypothetical protein
VSALDLDQRVLTCVMPKGVGLPLMRRLSDELGVVTASLHSARGLSGSDPTGMFNRVEKDVLTVTAPAAEAEDLFLWIYREGEVGTRPGRFLYVARLRGATPFRLPEGVAWEGA